MTAAVARRTSTTVTSRNRKASSPGSPSRRQTRGGGKTKPSTSSLGGLRLFSRSELRARARLRGGLAALCLLVVLGFFAIAFVQAQLVAGQQDLDQMRSQLDDLKKDRAQLAQAVDQASAPEVIVKRAHDELGMVRATQPVYLAAVSPAPKITTPVFVAPNDDGGGDLVAAQATEATVDADPSIDTTPAEPATSGAASSSPLAGSTAVVVGFGDG